MAVKEANSNYKSFTFNGISAADYGVYVTDVNVFNSAERAVEYITIPGRNGSFALDHGRFENITVVYDCALGQGTDVDFATAISDFRNALASAKGYQRLEDDMNPDEYRMAVFAKGLDAPTLNQQTATFKVEFNCKPQRYLKSGETAVIVARDATITNPTLFDASPLLEVYGYGDITLGNGGVVSIADDVLVGDVIVNNGGRYSFTTEPYTESFMYRDGYLENGDIITLAPSDMHLSIATQPNIASITASKTSGYDVGVNAVKVNSNNASVAVAWPEETFTVGTSKDLSAVVHVDIPTINTSGAIIAIDLSATISYNAANRTITRTIQTPSVTAYGTLIKSMRTSVDLGSITAYSTAPAYTEPLYFDLDIGEAYAIEDGVPVSINNAVSFGTVLPVLKPGANTITRSETITDLKIIPRWWKV